MGVRYWTPYSVSPTLFIPYDAQACGACSALIYFCMLAPNDRKQFEAVLSTLLASAEFSTEIECRKESCTCKRLGEYNCRFSVKSKRCSKTRF